jgi:hypothetical protein
MYLRLRLFRPILLEQVSKQYPIGARKAGNTHIATMQVENMLRERICQLCVTVAHDVLEELHLALSGKQRTSPWHALFCTASLFSQQLCATYRNCLLLLKVY